MELVWNFRKRLFLNIAISKHKAFNINIINKMKRELARYLTLLIVNHIDAHSASMMGVSSYEAVAIEDKFVKEEFDEIQDYLEKRL